jgi:hypothetical protein
MYIIFLGIYFKINKKTQLSRLLTYDNLLNDILESWAHLNNVAQISWWTVCWFVVNYAPMQNMVKCGCILLENKPAEQ